ncbi:hypothetical protein quinque_015330 [Culex quinquefasciatus]
MFLRVILLATAVCAYTSSSIGRNSFEATLGCLQYNSDTDYGFDHPYYPTANWRSIKRSTINGTVRMRMGVSGDKSAYIRLAQTARPFGDFVHEIVLGFFSDNRSYLQRYIRSSPSYVHSHQVFKLNYIKKISIFEPLMFTVEIYPNGRLTVTLDSEQHPFIDETDLGISTQYIGFANWNANDTAVFYVDCPL